jgi:hypothetical protein
MRRLYAVLVILMVLLTLVPVELLATPQAKASITAGYAPSVLNMPPIALQPVLHLPSSLVYASFISPTRFVASNYYVSAISGSTSAGIAWDGDTVVATVPSGITLNLTQAFGDTGSNYQQSLKQGNIYYTILYTPNTTAPELANFNPPPGADLITWGSGPSECLTVGPTQAFFFYINPFVGAGAGCGYGISYGFNPLTPEILSEGRTTFVSPITFAQRPSSKYWLLALEDPVAFYYTYINISEPLAVPASVPGGFGLGATDVPQIDSLYTLFRFGNYFFPSTPIAAWVVNYPFIIDTAPSPVVHYTSSGSVAWVGISSGVAFYPVEVSTPFVTPSLMTTGLNVSVSPGIGTVTLPYSFYKYVNNVSGFINSGGGALSYNNLTPTYIQGSLVNGPLRPTLIVAPLGITGTGEIIPWYQVAYFSPSDINETAEFYPLAVVPDGYDTYLILAGGIGVTHLYILKVYVVPGSLNVQFSTPYVSSLNLVNEINFAGYGNPTSAVVNGYYALVGTETGNVVLVNLLNGKILNYVHVADAPLFTYSNLQTQPNPVPVVPFFTANVTESLIESVYQAWVQIFTWRYGNNYWGLSALMFPQQPYLWNAIKPFYGGPHVIALVDWNLNTYTLTAPGYTVPFVNDVEGVNDPEYLYINGTVYQVIETGAYNLWNSPTAGISATTSLQATLSTGTPVSVPLPLTSKYAYVIDGVTVQVNKLTVLPGQTAHLVLYPWLQQGEIAYALNYGLINSSVLYTKYGSVSNLTTTSITYPSFYTQRLANELYDVGLSNVSTHFIVTMANVKLHPPPYFDTASAWVGTSINIPANAPVPLYSNLQATVGFQAYTDVVPMESNNPKGILATAFKEGAGPAFATSAVGYVANGIISAYMTSVTDATASSAALIASASVLSTAVEASGYVGIAIVVWAGIDYALAKWAGFGNAYIQDWVVMAPEFYDAQNGRMYTAVELVLPAEEATNVPHYEQVLGTFFNESGFSGYYFSVVYPFYTWSQLNASIASGAYQPEVNLTQLAQGLSYQYGIPMNDLVLTGVKLLIITRIHAKETFWQYIIGPVNFLMATVIGSTYLDIEGTTNAVTYTDPAQIADILQYASVDNFTAPFQVQNGQAVASVAIPPNDRLVVQLGGSPGAYANVTLEVHGYLITPLHNTSTGTWYGNLTYNRSMPLELGHTAVAIGLPGPPICGGNVSLNDPTVPVTDLAGIQYQGLYYYTGHVIPLGTITAGQTLTFTFYSNKSYLRPFAVPLANITGSDLPMFYGFLVDNPLNRTVNATLIAQVQSAPFNITPRALQQQKVTLVVPPGTSLIYVPMSALASYASSKGAYLNLTLVLSGAPKFNSTITEVWAPGRGLSSIAENPKPLSGITVYYYNALNGTVIGTGTAKPGADTLSVVNGTVYANATGSGSLVQGLVYAGAYSASWHIYNMTLGVFYNNTAVYLPAVPSTLKATVPWGTSPLANSSATYYWLSTWVTYSDGAPANATVLVYNGSKLIRQVNAYGVAYLALPKGTYLVSAKVYYPLNAPKGSEVLSNVTVNLTSNSLVRLSAPNWELPFYDNVLAIVGVAGPTTAVAGYGFTLPLSVYTYVLGVPMSNLTYSSALGSGVETNSLSNGSSVLPFNIPLGPTNGTYIFKIQLISNQNSTPINVSDTVAYYEVALWEVVYLYGLVYWHVVHQAHPPYLLPGDTIAVDVAYFGPPISVPAYARFNMTSPDLSQWPKLLTRPMIGFGESFKPLAGKTFWVNSTVTVPFAPYLVIAASYNSTDPYVVSWFTNVTVPIDPVANVSIVTALGSLISGKAVPFMLKVMSNVLPSQSHYVFINIYDNTTNKYVLTLFTQLQPVMYITKYVTLENSKILGIIPEPMQYHTMTLILTGVSIPFESVVRVLVVSDSFLIFLLIFLAILLLLVIAANATSGASHAIYNAMHRYVRRANADSGRRFVREVRESGHGWGHYVKRVEEEKDRKHYVHKE